MRTFDLPVAHFEALLSAFRQDVTVARYDSWPAVDDYCRRSANPVGRLVLRLFGYRDDRLDRWSDAICTALQLTNFWQDFAVDWARGRLYVPESEWRAAGARLEDLEARPAVMPREWQRALAACCTRTRGLFEHGKPLLDHVQRTPQVGAAGDLARRFARARSARAGPLRSDRRPAPARRRRCAGGRVEDAAVSRDTSFYYSFLVLPAAQRDAIVTVWDACRAIDDAVDEAASRTDAETRLRFWRGEIARVFDGGAPESPQGLALQPVAARFALPRRAFEDLVDGVQMDLEHTRYATFADLREYLLARRLHGRPHLPQHLRLPASRAAATTP